MSKTTVKADINFEQELWKAANELQCRSGRQYKDYIAADDFAKAHVERLKCVKKN